MRDFVRVTGLVRANVQTLQHVLEEGPGLTLNCGYGRGCSVREVMALVERRIGRRF